MSDRSKDAELNNNKFWRNVSDALDNMTGTSTINSSKFRGTIHAVYHEYQYQISGNQREHERAKDQWNSAWGGDTENLKRYDANK